MRVLVFGTGLFYCNRRKHLGSTIEIVGFLDNSKGKIGRKMDGVRIYAPKDAIILKHDLIILMSLSSTEMRKQLLSYGIDAETILDYSDYKKKWVDNELSVYLPPEDDLTAKEKQVMIVTPPMNYGGGTWAAIYLSLALKRIGYGSLILTSMADPHLIDEVRGMGLTVVVCPGLNELRIKGWIKKEKFCCIVVNTYQLMDVAVGLEDCAKIYLWLHEAEEFYKRYREKYDGIKLENLKKIHFLAVSEIAGLNFTRNHLLEEIDYMEYGCPDAFNIGSKDAKRSRAKVIFAVIGFVCLRKGQDILMEAIRMMDDKEKDKCEFRIIGEIQNDEYGKKIERESYELGNVHIEGKLERYEMNETIHKIDVVIMPSREDPLPIAVTEGMMYHKTCIVSDACGNKKYINHLENGLIFKSEDASDLLKQIQWCIRNRDRLNDIGDKARIIYDKVFAMDKFSKRIVRTLKL